MYRMEAPPPGFENLTPFEQIFVNDWVYSGSAVEGYVALLQNSQALAPTIRRYIKELNRYAKTPDSVKNTLVQQGWQALRNFLPEMQPVLHRHVAYLFVYGSMIYDDPHYLDFDLLVVGSTPEQEVEDLCSYTWRDKLEAMWPGSGGHITYLSMEMLKDRIAAIQEGSPEYFAEGGRGSMEGELDESSILLTGYPFYNPHPERLHEWRSYLLEQIECTPLLAAGVAIPLQEAVEIRRKRRGRLRSVAGDLHAGLLTLRSALKRNVPKIL
jgi:hypothetical protein